MKNNRKATTLFERYRFLLLRANLLRARFHYYYRVIAYMPRTLIALFQGRKRVVISSHKDFGNIINKGQQNIKIVQSTSEISDLIKQAQKERISININGASHSQNGHSLSREGWRVKLSKDGTREIKLLDNNLVEVPAETFWSTLEQYLNTHGRSCPVLTDNLLSTVGGTVSVGGIGTRSLISGRQIDAVAKILVVLANGDTVWCSSQKNAELFRHVLGGLGLIGFIDRIILHTIDYRPFLAVYEYQHPSLMHAIENIIEPFPHPETLPESLRHFNVEGPILETDFVLARFSFECHIREEATRFLRKPPELLEPLHPYSYRKKMGAEVRFQWVASEPDRS